MNGILPVDGLSFSAVSDRFVEQYSRRGRSPIVLTDAMMLVSPFHADYEFLTRPYHEEAPELWNTEGAGLA